MLNVTSQNVHEYSSIPNTIKKVMINANAVTQTLSNFLNNSLYRNKPNSYINSNQNYLYVRI